MRLPEWIKRLQRPAVSIVTAVVIVLIHQWLTRPHQRPSPLNQMTGQAPVARLYDVADLLGEAEAYAKLVEKVSLPKPRWLVWAPVNSGGVMGWPAPCPPTPIPKPNLKMAAAEDLASILMDTVDRDSWIDNGGRIGRIEVVGARLAVVQTPENQKRLAVMLELLASQRNAGAKP